MRIRALLCALVLPLAVQAAATSLTFNPPAGITARGKHVVLLSGDEEYRSEEALPMLCSLPRQVCHADLNPHNIVVSADHLVVAGVLDFGDMVETPRACDLGVAVAYQVDPEAPAESLADYVSAYTEVLPLTEAEVRLIPVLTEARWLTTLCIASHRAKRQPENAAYILRNVPLTRAGLLAFARLDRTDLQNRLLTVARMT